MLSGKADGDDAEVEAEAEVSQMREILNDKVWM